MKLTKILAACIAPVLLAATNTFAQSPAAAMPRLIEKDGRHALLVDGKPFLMLGGQAHNSSGWPGMMPQVWQAVNLMHLNTLEVPLYWEQIEAQPGKFDFSIVNTLLSQARQHKVRLVLLWFATWKNGSNHYMPQWMKQDAAKYPNVIGKKGQPVDSPSPHSQAALDADIKAFTAVMSYLKKADPQHTVIMVQVENESGSWDTQRDYSPTAQKLFDAPVPAELLNPAVLKALNVSANTSGTWEKVFGDRADEYFQAWSIARYVGKVAAAGKAVNSLPLYVNAALRDPLSNPHANEYESGGPTDNVFPIWKTAAPAIDLLAPDIYLKGSERILKVLELYNRPNNALFVPEAGLVADNAKYLYPTIAAGGIGFSPFGIEDNNHGAKPAELAERLAPYAKDYAVLNPMMTELARWSFEGKVKSAIELEDHGDQTIDLGNWQATVSFTKQKENTEPADKPTMGKLMIVQLSADKFIIIGSQSHITFKPLGKNAGKAWQYLVVEEGRFENDMFKSLRILNGDETDFGGPRLGDNTTVLQMTLGVR
jgi:hypothetical protein